MRVVQRRNGLGFALEPLLQIGIGGDVLGQHLDGDGAVEPRVGGFVDLPHAARAEGGVDLVGAERGTRLECHGSVDRHSGLQLFMPVENNRDLRQRGFASWERSCHQYPLPIW